MRKIFAALVLGGALALSACSTTASTTDPQATVEQVKQIATQVCGFVPTAATVLSILNLGNPALDTARSIAEAVCGAITSRSARAGATPRVQGVRIRGQFVQR